ncbi:MAG: glycosyltransferase family 4 protein [Terriglobales bacterium]
MRIALVVPPFIPVPPPRYGGTELFIANLAAGLRRLGHEPVVYANGESRPPAELRYLFSRMEWPITEDLHASLKDLAHCSWACRDAVADCEAIHLNNAPALAFTRFLEQAVVYTLHHPHIPSLSAFYGHFPRVRFVAISRAQAAVETEMEGLTVVHHGLDPDLYRLGDGRREYLCTIGRISPIKGTHHCITVARRAGIPLKIAGEIQPLFQEYWKTRIRPHVDGRFIEYVGEVGLEEKNQLLGGARAFLFPIEWEEPFGLVMIEAMACGAPVLAFGRGSAPEVVRNGVSGWICADAKDMAARAVEPELSAERCRAYFESHFALEAMARSYLRLYAAEAEAAETVLPAPVAA